MLVLCLASAVHILWGVILFAVGHDIRIAVTGLMVQLVPVYWARGLLYLMAGLLPLCFWWKPANAWAFLGLVPQQLLLYLNAAAAISAISHGQYADGVLRPRTFIAMDQGIYVIVAGLGMYEILRRFYHVCFDRQPLTS